MSENNQQTIRLLVVESSPSHARWIRNALAEITHIRFQLEMSESLHAALGRVATLPLDAILLGLPLADAHGISAVQKMRARAQGVPIVVIAGFDDAALARLLRWAGAQDCVERSDLDGGNLIRAIQNAIAAFGQEPLRSALDNNQGLLLRLLDFLREGVAIVDPQGDCVFGNSAAARILGYGSVDDFLGKNFHSLIRHSRPDGTPCPETECPVQLALRDRERVHEDTDIFLRVDATPVPVEYFSFPLRRTGNEIVTVMLFRAKDNQDEQRGAQP